MTLPRGYCERGAIEASGQSPLQSDWARSRPSNPSGASRPAREASVGKRSTSSTKESTSPACTPPPRMTRGTLSACSKFVCLAQIPSSLKCQP